MNQKIQLVILFTMLTHLNGFNINQTTLQIWLDNKELFKLFDLHLSGREIKSISNSTFKGMTSLEFIDLSHNKLSYLPPSLFHGLVKLERISMYYNQLKTLDEHQFFGLQNLRYIDLEHNQIANLAPNTFKSLKMLWYLDLDNNRLSQIDKKFLADVNSLKYFFLKNNNISLIEDGFIERFNELCISFFYFENNECDFVTNLHGSDKCIRINSTTCDLFKTQKLTKKPHEKWNSTGKEIEKLRYQVRSFREMNNNNRETITELTQKLSYLKQRNGFLDHENNHTQHEIAILKHEIILFSSRRMKDQKLIDNLITEYDDVKFMNTFLEEEIQKYQNNDIHLQKANLLNKMLNQEVESLRAIVYGHEKRLN